MLVTSDWLVVRLVTNTDLLVTMGDYHFGSGESVYMSKSLANRVWHFLELAYNDRNEITMTDKQ